MALSAADLQSYRPSDHSALESSANESANDEFEPFDPRGALNRRRAPSASSVHSARNSSLASSTSSIAIPGAKGPRLQPLSPLEHPHSRVSSNGISSSEEASTLSPTDYRSRSPNASRSYDELLDARRRETSSTVCQLHHCVTVRLNMS